MTLVDSISDSPVSLDFDLLMVDLDDTPNFQEFVKVSGASFAVVASNTDLTVVNQGGGDFKAFAVNNGQTNPADQRAWFGAGFRNVNTFTFTWGFEGKSITPNFNVRGTFIDGDSDNTFDSPFYILASAPEPSTGVLGLIGIAFLRAIKTHSNQAANSKQRLRVKCYRTRRRNY